MTFLKKIAITFPVVLIYFVILTIFYANKNYGFKKIEETLQEEVLKVEKNGYNKNTTNPPTTAFLPSNDSLNPFSPYYGMHYKNTYGLPLSENGSVKTFEKVYEEDWKLFFPALVFAFETYESNNPTRSRMFFTREIVAKAARKQFSVGEDFLAILKATDITGQAKSFGGDYIRARLIREPARFHDGIPCRVFDNSDGTYSVQAPLPVEGRFLLDVKLIWPVEGIYELNEKQTSLKSWNSVKYFATYESGEVMPCDAFHSVDTMSKNTPWCDYSNPRTNDPWFCEEPSSGKCSPLSYINYTTRSSTHLNVQQMCSQYKCNTTFETRITITVSPRTKFSVSELHECSEQFGKQALTFPVSGYFNNNKWILLLCKRIQRNLQTELFLLKNKIIYFFGDATIRQFYYLFQQTAQLQDTSLDNEFILQQPRIATSFSKWDRNVTMYYRAHGPPLQNPGPAYTRPYISDSITGITKGGKDVYVIFSIGVHFSHYDPSLYIHRLKGIKNAILQHQKLFSETKFMVKGMNVVEHHLEWNTFRLETILKETFKDMKNVVFLNFWDMSMMYNLVDIHPHGSLLAEQGLTILSYIT